MKKINILYIENGLGFGGATTCLVALLKRLDKEKYNPVVISSHNDLETRELVKDTGAKFYYVKGYKRSNSLNQLIYKLDTISFIVKGFVLLLVVFAEKICQIPFFIKAMNIARKNKISAMHLNTGINTNLEGIILSKLLRIPCICHERGPAYNSFESRSVAKYVTAFIPISKFVEKSIQNLGVFDNKIRVIYDGIDMNECADKVESAKSGKLEKYAFGKYNIGLFACLLPWKGQKVFIKTAEVLIKDRNLKDCKFFIVGEVPDKKSTYKNELISLVDNLGIKDFVIFTGYQDNVYQFMNKMDIVVHTSINPEPFGRVIIEAMALGKPVIATKMGGPLEIIEDGINGILIPPNNPFILAETISSLLKDRNKLEQIGINAKGAIKNNFAIINYVRDIEKIYEEVIN